MAKNSSVDYGKLGGRGSTSTSQSTVARSQVYRATHDGEGNHLSSLRRSFISFSFGGKDIEDFDLIAYCKGDTMTRSLYADFEDLTVNYNILDGESYLGTHFKPYTLALDLVTDGMEQQTLEEFKYWFRGGVVRELILAESPNRAIMARVSSPPQMSMTPYEKRITKKIAGLEYETSTTLYKGMITLSFQAEQPYWYTLHNIVGYKKNGTFYPTQWKGKSIYDDLNTREEVLKIIHEDGTPLLSMISDTMFFGVDYYAKVKDEDYNLIVEEVENQNDPTLSIRPGMFIYDGLWYRGAVVEENNQSTISGRISGSVSQSIGNGTIFNNAESYYFYYPGTAPSPVTISFTVPIEFNDNGYIKSFYNEYAYANSSKPYNTFTFTALHTKQFKLTTPNIMTSYNKVIYYFRSISAGSTTWGDLEETIRDNIRHPAVRENTLYLISLLWSNARALDSEVSVISQEDKEQLLTDIKTFWQNSSGNNYSASFSFNAYTGESYGTFSYCMKGYTQNPSRKTDQKENVGDMLRSNYICLEDRNIFTTAGFVSSDNRTHSYKLTHDFAVELTKFKLEYRTMYL